MPDTLSNVHAWQAFLFFAGGLICGFVLFLILYKEKLAALRDLEERELWSDIFKAHADAHAKIAKSLMEGKI